MSNTSSVPNVAASADLAALYAKRPQVIKPGLDRIRAALPYLENLLPKRCILVAGTNGKGSTSAYLWRLLAAHGARVGLYTSPHLKHFSERYWHSHAALDDDAMVTAHAALRTVLPESVYEPMSFFEVATLLALQTFRDLDTEIAVLEVGLGGRWDATNIVDPDLSIITSIGLDHQEYLGNTIADIAAEKAGIMRPGHPVIWGGQAADAADRVVRESAATHKAPLVEWGANLRFAPEGLTIAWPGQAPAMIQLPDDLRRAPSFLQRNFALAAAAFVGLGHSAVDLTQAILRLDQGAIAMPPCLRGRFQKLHGAPTPWHARALLLDVAHNPDGARALVEGLQEIGLLAEGPLPGIVSVLADKDHAAVLDILREALHPLILIPCRSERSWSGHVLAPRHRDLPFVEDLASAWPLLPSIDGRPVVITGSVYAVGEIMEIVDARS